MKTKKINFDWSIFIAVMTIFVVIICGVVCCCLALPSNDNGIAKAQENVDYLVAPGDSYTSIESHASIFNNSNLTYNQNTVYFNFNFKYDEIEFFNIFSDIIDGEFVDATGGLDDSYYAYPLFSYDVTRGNNSRPLFTVLVLGWDSHPHESGIYIMDDNFVVDNTFSEQFFEMLSNYNEFYNANYDFIFARFTRGNSAFDSYSVDSYSNLISCNFLATYEESFHLSCFFDSTYITDVLQGYASYSGSELQYLDRVFSANGIFNDDPVYIAPEVSGIIGSVDYSFKGYCNFNFNIENNYINTLSFDFLEWVGDNYSDTLYYSDYGLIYVLASCSVSDDPFIYYFGIVDDDGSFVIVSEESGRFLKPLRYNLDSYLPFGFYSSYYCDLANFGFSYISPFWYSDYCSLDIGMFFSMSDNFLSYGDVQVLKQQKAFNEELAEKEIEIDNAYENGYQTGVNEGYNQGFSAGHTSGYDTGYDAGYSVGENDGFTDGYTDAINTFKTNNITSNVDYFDRYSFQYDDNGSWKQAPTFEIQSIVWLNNPDSNYLFTTKYFNLSNVYGQLTDYANTTYKNFTLYAKERFVGNSSLSITFAIESLAEEFVIFFFDGSNHKYTLTMSTTYQNGVPVCYGSVPTGVPFTHIVLDYIDSYALFSQDAINQIVITENTAFIDSFNDGYQSGEQSGYNKGYSDALERFANSDISFFTLITSVVDAPIQMIVGKWNPVTQQMEGGMLNFYIPGLDINLAPFLLSMFTVCLVIMVVRFILARKE